MKHVEINDLISGEMYLIFTTEDDGGIASVDYAEVQWDGDPCARSKYCFIVGSGHPTDLKVLAVQLDDDDDDLGLPVNLANPDVTTIAYELTEDEYLNSIALRCI